MGSLICGGRGEASDSFPGLREYGFNVDASAGTGFDVGFNPVELVDFVLGWTPST